MGLKLTWVCLLILSLSVCVTEAQGETKDFNVKNYGAIADGATDNSKVILFFICFLCYDGFNQDRSQSQMLR